MHNSLMYAIDTCFGSYVNTSVYYAHGVCAYINKPNSDLYSVVILLYYLASLALWLPLDIIYELNVLVLTNAEVTFPMCVSCQCGSCLLYISVYYILKRQLPAEKIFQQFF